MSDNVVPLHGRPNELVAAQERLREATKELDAAKEELIKAQREYDKLYREWWRRV